MLIAFAHARILLYCTENAAGIHACIRERGQGSLDPPKNRRNIVFPCNAGPVKNHKVANLAFNVGPSSRRFSAIVFYLPLHKF